MAAGWLGEFERHSRGGAGLSFGATAKDRGIQAAVSRRVGVRVADGQGQQATTCVVNSSDTHGSRRP